MTHEAPTQDMIDRWHRWFAVECNNQAWALSSKTHRTATEDTDLLRMAQASSFHWSKVGTALNEARAELLLAHVHAVLGSAEASLRHARGCLALVTSHPAEDWDLAFAHAELAHAAAVAGDAALHAEHYEEARRLGAAIGDDEDRQVFLQEFAHVPAPGGRAPQPRHI